MSSTPGAVSVGADAGSDDSSVQETREVTPPPQDTAGFQAAVGDAKPAAVESRSGPPQRTADISFDDIKFEMLKGEPFQRSMITSKIEALDGRPVRIRGFILPSFQQAGLTQFVLVRDNLSCCFGPGAALYDCIVVDMQPGKSTDYNIAPVTVEGTFAIRELLDSDGKALAIYHLDGDTVR
ncbi:MAG TPA: DUF3299 domain-containing protein [Pirellulales bacterium]|nr:DUF3299 domain-containing protein [Pirellulales bacterium]